MQPRDRRPFSDCPPPAGSWGEQRESSCSAHVSQALGFGALLILPGDTWTRSVGPLKRREQAGTAVPKVVVGRGQRGAHRSPVLTSKATGCFCARRFKQPCHPGAPVTQVCSQVVPFASPALPGLIRGGSHCCANATSWSEQSHPPIIYIYFFVGHLLCTRSCASHWIHTR